MKPVVAFFASQMTQGVPRGAMRLFRAMAMELCTRDDIEVIALGEFASDPADPLACTYVRHSAKDWLEFSHGVPNVHSPLDDLIQPVPAKAPAGALRKLRQIYRDLLPYRLRVALQPLAAVALTLAGHARSAASPPGQPEQSSSPDPIGLLRPNRRDDTGFTNDDIVAKLISLEQVDVLLDFWWFHLSERSPLHGRYRPPNLRVIAWFLDAIPLRMPAWTPGQIAASGFRSVLQPHLDAADEIVAISHCSADDVKTFFPQVASKPIHMVPCGVFAEDFVSAHGSDFLRQKLGVDPAAPIFVLVGALEPSKNLANSLRGLTRFAEQTGSLVQVVIIGAVAGTDLAPIMGPFLTPLLKRAKVVFTGMISESAKRMILSNATALIYASKWEGFGIPPLEAMAAGLPVIVSDIPTSHENCGELAEYCDPHDFRSIAAALGRLLEKSPNELAAWRDRARSHAKMFTWPAAVDALLGIITSYPVKEPNCSRMPSRSIRS